MIVELVLDDGLLVRYTPVNVATRITTKTATTRDVFFCMCLLLTNEVTCVSEIWILSLF